MSKLFSRLRERMSVSTIATWFASRRTLIALGVGFALLNAALWFATPAIRTAVDASAGRLDAPNRPVIINGVQELLVYYDPWLAWYVFPVVFTVGFAAIPFLCVPSASGFNGGMSSFVLVRIASFALILFELVWLFLIWVGVWCRGPNWHFYWPWEKWEPARVEVFDKVTLSEAFWTRMFGIPTEDMSWLIRESPGLLLLGIYFVIGFLLVAWLRWKKAGFWQLATAAFVLQLALAIPIKMVCRASFDLKYIVSIPELLANI